MDSDLRSFLLKPLKSPEEVDDGFLQQAAKHLDSLALDTKILDAIKPCIQKLQSILEASEENCSDKERRLIQARINVLLSKGLRGARSISEEEYIYQSTYLIEHIHEDRWMNGDYDLKLEPISNKINRIKESFNLESDEDWPPGEGPLEYQELNDQYENILSQEFINTLREFSLDDIADIQEQNPEKYRMLRERGRRTLFHPNERIEAVQDIVSRYEEEARKSVEAQAYSAAAIVLGAGMEGLLLMRCLREPEKAKAAAKALPNKVDNDPTRWSFNTLIEVCLSKGWLPSLATPIGTYDSEKLAHFLRVQRNLVHPGKQIRSCPWLSMNEEDYKDLKAIYFLLKENIVDNSDIGDV